MADVCEVDAETGETIERAFTPAERAQAEADAVVMAQTVAALEQRSTNLETLHAQAEAALAQNKIAIAAKPNTVTLAQVAGQVQALSAQNNALIRIVLGLLDSTD